MSMTNEFIQHLLNKVIKDMYPEIDTVIYVSKEPDMIYMSLTQKMIYNVFFDLSEDDFNKYVREGLDEPMWDKIREFIRDFIKMLGINDRVMFYFNNRED